MVATTSASDRAYRETAFTRSSSVMVVVAIAIVLLYSPRGAITVPGTVVPRRAV
jgi:hypothetical protein